MSDFQVKGEQYEVTDETGHCFAKGDIVTLYTTRECEYEQGPAYTFTGVSKNFGFSVEQDLFTTQVQRVGVAPVVADVTKVPVPRVNYLYVVEDEDGVYLKTFDRDHAREQKAALGGKKAGVVITAYAAVKEIR